MRKIRLVAILVVREGQVVQSVKFKHTNVIHSDPIHAMDCFNRWDVDEIVVLNVSRNVETRDDFLQLIDRISARCFVPITVGGWITDTKYASMLLRSGADKLSLNTAFHTDPVFTKQLALLYGSQCIVASIDIKSLPDGTRSVVVDRGRVDIGVSPTDWARRAVELGAGEILLNSIDHDGNRGGYDLVAVKEICRNVTVPVIAFGGVAQWNHLADGVEAGADAVAVANALHYTEHSVRKAKEFLINSGISIRKLSPPLGLKEQK